MYARNTPLFKHRSLGGGCPPSNQHTTAPQEVPSERKERWIICLLRSACLISHWSNFLSSRQYPWIRIDVTKSKSGEHRRATDVSGSSRPGAGWGQVAMESEEAPLCYSHCKIFTLVRHPSSACTHFSFRGLQTGERWRCSTQLLQRQFSISPTCGSFCDFYF